MHVYQKARVWRRCNPGLLWAFATSTLTGRLEGTAFSLDYVSSTVSRYSCPPTGTFSLIDTRVYTVQPCRAARTYDQLRAVRRLG